MLGDPNRSLTIPDFVKGAIFTFVLLAIALAFALHKSSEQQQNGSRYGQVVSPVSEAGASKQKPEANQAKRAVTDNGPLNTLADWLLDMKVSDFLLVAFTAVLAWKTAGLDESTRALWKAGEDQRSLSERVAAQQASDMRAAIAAAELSAQAARDQVALSRQTLVDTNRAFVFMERVEWRPILRSNVDLVSAWEFTPIWKNAGNTPTRMMQSCVYDTTCIGVTLPDDFGYVDDQPWGDSLIHKNSIMHGRKVNFDNLILSHAMLGLAHIYVWGWADYNDFFEDTPRHRVEFCFEIEPVGNPTLKDCRFNLRRHGPFNGFDQDCYRQPQPYRPLSPIA